MARLLPEAGTLEQLCQHAVMALLVRALERVGEDDRAATFDQLRDDHAQCGCVLVLVERVAREQPDVLRLVINW